ncbi:ABC transporter [Paecilomyces variotii No. 5]|uniref:ABC transporter n=1 Tax=Byssochlamys spectabilis (strain No. 5 / NBRC 109023) TaxID=1356009 RepID=V5FTW7_BYSSN|nr:ABC transporter [Paecilomyces variotii No. 5]
MPSTLCSTEVEDVFGPVVARSCLGGFDFTLLFEETILAIPLLAIALLLAIPRLHVLHKAAIKLKHSHHVSCKVLAYLAYIGLQVVLLTLWAQPHVAKTRATLATTALSLAASAPFMWLSYWEHMRSLRPSTLLTLYLGLSTLLDLARLRTLFFFDAGHKITSVFLAGYCVKVFILGLELIEKRKLLLDDWKASAPEATASVYRRALFLWLNRLFARSYRSILSLETLPKIDDDILAASNIDILRSRWANADKSNRYALLWTFVVHYKWTILAACLPRLAYTGFTFAQPFLIDRVLSFTSGSRDNRSANEGYGLIGAYAIVYIGAAISLPLYEHKVYRTLAKFRGSLTAMIYEKTLLLSSSGSSSAEAITLMSADIDRLGICMQDLHEVYAGSLEVALCLWLLYVYLGVAAAAVAAFNVLCLAASVPIATAAGKAQVPWLNAIETRLTETANTLGNFKLIRMTGLTEGVSSVLRSLRSAEIAAARRYRVLNVLISIGYYLSYAFSPVWGFGTYILVSKANGSGTLTQGTAFGAMALFQLLNKPTVLIIDGIEHAQTVIECFARMQGFMTRPEIEAYRTPISKRQAVEEDVNISEKSIQLKEQMPIREDDPPVAAVMRRLTLRYSSEQTPVLRDISLEIPSFKTTMIVGPVGCGKSSLLRLLLGEVPPPDNHLFTNFTRAAYCAQQPWVFKATIRDNIVGVCPWDEAWYRQVLQACGLVRDISDLPHGDQTEAGMSGSSLSGGQRIRLSLARALYSREPILILDDVLTGLDPTTEQTVSAAVFGPTGLVKQTRSTVIMATSSAHHIHFADNVVVLEKGGRLAQNLSAQDFLSIGPQLQSDDVSESPHMSKSNQRPSEMPLLELGIPVNDGEEAAASRQLGDITAYIFYGRVAGWKVVSIWLSFSAIFMFGLNFPSVWLQWWVDANEQNPNARIGYWLGVFAGLGCLAIVANIVGDCMLQLVMVPKTSANFHELLLSTTTRARTAFLASTHAGSILNRFSQDLELIDSDLPGALDKTMFSILQTLFTTVLVFVGSKYLAIALPVCLLAVYGIQHYYLRTSRQLRHVDIEAREPLFSHFLDTVTSIDSIRAYGWMDEYKRRNREALNTSQSPYYLMWSIQRWLTLVLNLFVAGLAILLVALATNIQGASTGLLGVALSNIVNFGTTLQLLVTDWTQLETAICAVSRIKTYISDTQPEESHDELAPAPLNWPTEGTIIFDGVTASYPSAPEPILRDINLTISPGEKIAICGRTGSGKSTLMSTLLRMVELDAGTITIDGTNIVDVPREAVRRCLTTMPQETFFITGTVRQNLDPFHLANDETLTSMLEELALRDLVDAAGGLDAELKNEMFSSGQQQLFCLARAIVRGGPILLLDEATSSVDSTTSDLMQHMLLKKFSDKTVIAIAHRLETVIDFDRIIVLDRGQIIESGNPKELLAMPGSAFKLLSENMDGLVDKP